MKKLFLLVSTLAVFSCASNQEKTDRIPAQVGNVGSFLNSDASIAPSCTIRFYDGEGSKFIYEMAAVGRCKLIKKFNDGGNEDWYNTMLTLTASKVIFRERLENGNIQYSEFRFRTNATDF